MSATHKITNSQDGDVLTWGSLRFGWEVGPSPHPSSHRAPSRPRADRTAPHTQTSPTAPDDKKQELCQITQKPRWWLKHIKSHVKIQIGGVPIRFYDKYLKILRILTLLQNLGSQYLCEGLRFKHIFVKKITQNHLSFIVRTTLLSLTSSFSHLSGRTVKESDHLSPYLRNIFLLSNTDKVFKHGHHWRSSDHVTVDQVRQKTDLQGQQRKKGS